jgi:hypothetical protein
VATALCRRETTVRLGPPRPTFPKLRRGKQSEAATGGDLGLCWFLPVGLPAQLRPAFCFS